MASVNGMANPECGRLAIKRRMKMRRGRRELVAAGDKARDIERSKAWHRAGWTVC